MKRATVALCVAAGVIAAAPIPASAAGVDEYSLNLPDGGSGTSPDGGGGESTSPAPTTTAPAPATVYPTTTTTETETTVVTPTGVVKKKPPKPEPVFASSSLNATIGPQEVPPLEVAAPDEGAPVVAIVLALLAALCCALAVWRMRFLRELPVAPRPRGSRGIPAS